MVSRSLALSAVAILALCAVASASLTASIDFEANTNVSVNGVLVSAQALADSGLQLRAKPLSFGTFQKVGDGFIAATLGAEIGFGSLGVDAEVDVAGLVSNAGPYTANAHFNASLTAIPPLNFDAQHSSSYIATFPIFLVEIDAAGTDIVVHAIKDMAFNVLNSVTSAVEGEIGVIAYHAIAANSGSGNGNFELTFTLQTSVRAGVSTYELFDLLPKSWAWASNVTGYVFQNAGNSLRFVHGVATSETNVVLNVDGEITCPYGNDDQNLLQAYVDLSTNVTDSITGTHYQATVSAFAKTTFEALDLFPAIKAQVQARYGSSAALYIGNVTYPAGIAECTSRSRSASGRRLKEASANAPEPSQNPAPVTPGSPDTPTPSGNPSTPIFVPPGTPVTPATPVSNPSVPNSAPFGEPSSATSVSISAALFIASLAVLGLVF